MFWCRNLVLVQVSLYLSLHFFLISDKGTIKIKVSQSYNQPILLTVNIHKVAVCTEPDNHNVPRCHQISEARHIWRFGETVSSMREATSSTTTPLWRWTAKAQLFSSRPTSQFISPGRKVSLRTNCVCNAKYLSAFDTGYVQITIVLHTMHCILPNTFFKKKRAYIKQP